MAQHVEYKLNWVSRVRDTLGSKTSFLILCPTIDRLLMKPIALVKMLEFPFLVLLVRPEYKFL